MDAVIVTLIQPHINISITLTTLTAINLLIIIIKFKNECLTSV
jgi:hypothetical protein